MAPKRMLNPGVQGVTTNPPMRAPRGSELSCRGWQQEAALRMLLNSLDPEVAERPDDLIPCAAAGKLAADSNALRDIVTALRQLSDEETLHVAPGHPPRALRAQSGAPRVLIANASWAYGGTQCLVPTSYEAFSAAARQHFGGAFSGRLVVSAGMGASGGAASLAAKANGAAFLGIDVDAERIKRRVRTGYCDILVLNLDEALRILRNAVRKREAVSVGLAGNSADLLPMLARRGVVPDLLADYTPASRESEAYAPQKLTLEQAAALRGSDAQAYRQRALDSIAEHIGGITDLQRLGSIALEHGRREQELFAESRAPLLWVALSGEARDMERADGLATEVFRNDDVALKELELTRRLPRFQGLPARLCWPTYGDRAKFGVAFNGLVARGEVQGPFALAADQLPLSPVGTPFAGGSRSSPEAGWAEGPLLDATRGAAWVSLQPPLPGPSQYPRAGWGVAADGSPQSAERIGRLLANDRALWKARN